MAAARRKIKQLYLLCPVRHCLTAFGALVIFLHLLLRGDHDLMQTLSQHVIRPVHRALSVLNSHVGFSVAELLLALSVTGVLVFTVFQLARLFRCPEKLKRLYRLLLTYLCLFCLVYGGFCALWGVYYYGDDFTETAGLNDGAVSVEDLTAVTRYFAEQANYWSSRVERDADGLYTADRQEILEKSSEVFDNTVAEFPCLAGPDIRAKGVYCSRIMSLIDFTGFFFPFTAEANVNTDFPPSLFAATVAHELSHQRGVAKEQEANFTAVLACLNYGDPDYCYSACLLAYTHLGNALHNADYDAWLEIYSSLDENILKDFAANNAYWAQFETPVQTVSNTVYESFLQSYDQKLGMKSYGACVDLLVNYYKDIAGAG